MKSYITNPKWKRIRWIVAIIYLLLIVSLLIGAILLIIYSERCPAKAKLVWYEKEIIYEVDLTTFRDSNGDGFGDIKGLQENLKYFEENHVKSILLRSTLFNGTTDQLNGNIAEEKDLQDFAKILNRKGFFFQTFSSSQLEICSSKICI